jgi:hypothetical protein
MSGAIPPLPNTHARRGAQLKHRDNFTFFTFTVFRINWIIQSNARTLVPQCHKLVACDLSKEKVRWK